MISKNITLNEVNSFSKNTLLSHLNIEFTKIGNDYLEAKMPVNHKTTQPMGILHGGASVALAESIGSVGSNLLIDTKLESWAINSSYPKKKLVVMGDVIWVPR